MLTQIGTLNDSKGLFETSLRFLGKDSRSLATAAETVSVAFDKDPLILWLRRGAPTWGLLQPETLRWQTRRIARAQLNGIIMCAASRRLDEEIQTGTAATSKRSICADERFAGIAILHAPKEKRGWNWLDFKYFFHALWLKLQEWRDPVVDHGSIMKRVDSMMVAHTTNLAKQSSIFQDKPIWYLEVCCTRTSAQGRGVGKRLMEWVLRETQNAVCLLECTDEKNIAFYRRFGFEVAETIDLRDGEDVVNIWLMVKP